jgi:two-component system chemotaxis response regulator CheY
LAAVLLVEDVAILRMILRGFLESGGHGVTECDGGKEASRLIGDNRFDAVVTDIFMKDGDGLTFISKQRSNGVTIPIIAMTGGDPRSPQSKSGHLALRAGANRILMKPVTKSEILSAIADTVGSLA